MAAIWQELAPGEGEEASQEEEEEGDGGETQPRATPSHALATGAQQPDAMVVVGGLLLAELLRPWVVGEEQSKERER
jgi:hypothetical protein